MLDRIIELSILVNLRIILPSIIKYDLTAFFISEKV